MSNFAPIDPYAVIKRLELRIKELESQLKTAEEERDKYKRKLRRAEKKD